LFFLIAPSTSCIYTLSLHDALPIWYWSGIWLSCVCASSLTPEFPAYATSSSMLFGSSYCTLKFHCIEYGVRSRRNCPLIDCPTRSEEHTSELQSLRHLVCRLLLEKK